MEIITTIFEFLINRIYTLTKDYGVTIVIITIAIRFCLIPFNIKQRLQMKKQQETNREANALKAKYGRDTEKLNSELQQLYQKNGTGIGSCLVPFLQLPIMLGLYKAIQVITTAGATTILLPWITSILLKDHLLLLPIATIIMQLLPQIYPYLCFFKNLELQKAPLSSVLMILFANSFFVFSIPSGIGLYYFTSGLFTALEQFILNLIDAHRAKIASAT